MAFPVTIPFTFGNLSGIVPASDLDTNFSNLVTGLNGINNGSYPLTAASITGTSSWAGSPITITYGGTGLTSTPTNGQLLIGNGSGYTLSTLTAGSGIVITNTVGGITIASTPTGTVTSVNVSGGSTGFTMSGGPITSSGTITMSGTLNVANGGTGLATLTSGSLMVGAGTGPVNFIAPGTAGNFLGSNGSSWSSTPLTLTVNTTALSGGTSGKVLYDNAGTVGELTTTGSGNVVLATSPTLVTPNLGTPSTVTLTNGTGLPIGAGTTGTLATTRGGTGLISYTKGDILYSSATDTLAKLPIGTEGYALYISGGLPTWSNPSSARVTSLSFGTTGLTPSTTTTGAITVAGTLNVTNGGTGVTSSTGSGSVVLSTSPTLVTPALGTPSSVILTNATGLRISGISATGTPSSTTYLRGDGTWAVLSAVTSSIAINTTAITGGTTGRILYDNAGTVGELASIPVANGGTGLTTTPANGQIDIGNGTGFTRATLTAGSGITITNAAGSITIASSGGGTGTVTSVAVSGGTTGLTTSGGPVTSSGTITLSGTLAIANGGTGATTASAALTALGGCSTGKAIAMAIVFGG